MVPLDMKFVVLPSIALVMVLTMVFVVPLFMGLVFSPLCVCVCVREREREREIKLLTCVYTWFCFLFFFFFFWLEKCIDLDLEKYKKCCMCRHLILYQLITFGL